MSKIFGSLFGKKATPVQTQPTGFESLPGFGQDLIRNIVSRGEGLADQPGLFAPVPFSDAQTQALQQLQAGVGTPLIGAFDFGQRGSQAFDQAGGTFNRALQSFQAGQAPITGEQLQQGIGEFLNPFTQQVIDPAVQDVEDAAQRRRSILEGGASGNLGAFSGARTGIESGLLSRDVLRETGRIGGQLRSQAFNTASQQALSRLTGERNRALSAGQGITGVGGQQTGLGQNLLGARQTIQNIRDQVRDAEVGRLTGMVGAGDIFRQQQLQEQQIPLQQLELLQNIFGNIPGGGGGSQLRDNPGAIQRVGDASKGLGSIGAAFSAFSDERLKENIKLVGNKKGFNIYEFNYIGGTVRFSGVMAQEVQETRPDAVQELQGHLTVNYDKIGLEMREVA